MDNKDMNFAAERDQAIDQGLRSYMNGIYAAWLEAF